MKTTRLLPWILFFSGALIYVIGFWRACPLLSGKGYFFGVLMKGMFVTYAYQRAVNLNQNDERFASVGGNVNWNTTENSMEVPQKTKNITTL